MELLVVGATSYIGNEIYKEAQRRNIKVKGTRHKTHIADLLEYDITTDDIVNIIKDFSSNEKYAVICSAIPTIDTCYSQREYAYKINVTSTIKLLHILSELGFKTVFLSTDSVFSGTDGYYSEFEKPEAINEYGRMKIEVENYILKHFNNNCIMRISKIIGAKPHKRNIFTEWYNLAKQNKPIVCIKGNIFSPTDIDDIVNCFFIILEKNTRGLYNVCNGEHFERIELAYQFIRKLNINAELINKPVEEFNNFKDARPLKTYMSNDKFVEKTGYCFRSVDSIIKQYKIFSH